MKNIKKHIFLKCAIALFIATAVIYFSPSAPLTRLTQGVLDTFFYLKTPPPYDPKIIIIEIDDRNIDMVGRWPWGRDWHATMVQVLKDLGAKQICFDIIFSEPASKREDNLFAEAIKLAGNVYLPFVFKSRTIDKKDTVMPIKVFLDCAKDTGTINIYPDTDGTLRRVPLYFSDNGGFSYHMALRVAADHLNVKVKEVTPRRLVLSSARKKIDIPFIEENRMLVNWTGKWKDTFRHYAYLEILSAYKTIKDGGEPGINVEAFKDSICIIGATAVGLHDIKAVPLEAEYPAIGVLATAISNILSGDFIKTIPKWGNWLLICLLALLPALSVSGNKPLREAVVVLSYAPLFFTVSFLLFRLGLWVDCSLPLFAFFGSYSAVAIYNFTDVSLERQHLFAMSITDGLTDLYNIRHFKTVLEKECHAEKRMVHKRFCVILVDIDDFKGINDVFGHNVGDFILRDMADIIKGSVRSSDVVARYGGDEILILLKGALLDTGMMFAEKIRMNIEERIIKDKDKTYTMTISLGVASFKKGDTVEGMIKRADEGLYQAKESGRNSVSTVEPLEG